MTGFAWHARVHTLAADDVARVIADRHGDGVYILDVFADLQAIAEFRDPAQALEERCGPLVHLEAQSH